MEFKIWVGKRESDILTYKYFDMSITFWGSNKNNNHSFCTTERLKDNYGNDFTQYVLNILLKSIKQNKNKEIKVHFYNNSFAYKLISIEPILKTYIVNLNSMRVFDIVRHKTLSRLWLQNTVDVPAFAFLSKNECHYELLKNKFMSYEQFVIQKNISGGGNGTYLMNINNWEEIIYNLCDNDVYLVSPYYSKNISLSCHLIVEDKQIIVFPVSKQLLSRENNRLSYCGNEYLKNDNILSSHVKMITKIIGNRLKCISYKGICGLDFICSNNKIMLIEINPRYQGSSYLINDELNRLNLPSLFELNELAFKNKISKDIAISIENMDILNTSHTCTYNASSYKVHSQDILVKNPQNANIFFDGLINSYKYEDGVYLYRYIEPSN